MLGGLAMASALTDIVCVQGKYLRECLRVMEVEGGRAGMPK